LDEPDTRREEQQMFQEFVGKHNKNYLTKDEYKARLAIFKANLEIVRTHNAKNESYELEMNKFADFSPEEFGKLMGLRPPEEMPLDIEGPV
jgi:hypothetical protein